MTIAELKHALDQTHPRRAGQRVPAELRQELCRHIRQARNSGVSWTALAQQTGLRCATLMRIGQEPAVAAPPRLVPVLAGHTEPDAGGLVLLHKPLTRQCQEMAHQGLVVDSQTLWDQISALAKHLQNAYDSLRVRVLGRPDAIWDVTGTATDTTSRGISQSVDRRRVRFSIVTPTIVRWGGDVLRMQNANG